MVMVNLGSTDDSRYTGYREITDRDVLDLQCIAIPSRPFVEFHYPPTERFRGYSFQHGIHPFVHPSIHLSVHRHIIVHPITSNYPLSYFQETVRL